MKTCIYCGEDKGASEFSDEHIWPEALGGDHLPDFWRTDDVCEKCNNLSGLYVDGAFVKGWGPCGSLHNWSLRNDVMPTLPSSLSAESRSDLVKVPKDAR
jgi:hypothetical protein